MRLGHVTLESLPSDHTIEIEPLASHPIARCLGLDAGPLTPLAKALMTVQSLTALVTIGLVVARAVNILN